MTYTELDRDAVDRALPNDAPLPVDPSPSDDLGHRDSRHASVGGGTLLDRGHRWDGSRFTSAPVDPSLPADRGRNDASTVSVGGETPLDRGPRRLDTHTPVAPVDPPLPDPAGVRPTPQTVASDPGAFDELRILAESFEDAQKARIAIENRLRGAVVSDASLDALDALRLAEKRLGLAMRRSFRKAAPELAAWQKETVGVGEHLLARLLGTIGDPYIARPHHWEGEGSARVLVADEPFARNVAKLWAYTGHGDPGRRRRKGMSADEAFALGNPRAKMIVHLLAEGAMKLSLIHI